MTAPRQIFLALIAIFACMGATYPTPNFVVHAPNQQIAQQVGQWAEYYRKQKAVEWLGREMPRWPQQCPLYVTVSMEGPSGATSFNFGRDQSGRGVVMGQRMEIQGPLDRLLASVLPHEITHTVFAYHFKQPVPRWADEGGSVLSEDDIERERHNKLVRHILNSQQQIPMKTLFALREYPRNVMALYAQGYSISDYLIKRSDRQHFLNFVGHGMTYGWDNAVWTYYRHRNVEDLEENWLQYLRDTKGRPHIEVAQNGKTQQYEKESGTVVRLTVPPSVNSATNQPVFRGAMPTGQDGGQTFGGNTLASQQRNQPGYLPEYDPRQNPDWRGTTQQPTQPAPRYNYQQQQRQQPQGYNPVPVSLGTPQFNGGGSNQPLPTPVPRNVSPIGFPQ